MLGALALLLAFAFQGSRGLWEPDEGRYTAVATEMLAMGDFVTPHRHHHHIHPTKPPMTYWAIASGITVFGHSEWGVRAPYAVAFAATVLLVGIIGRRLVPAMPLLPAMIYGAMLLPFLSANVVTTDVFLTLFVTAAMAAYLGTGGSRAGVRLMWLCFGLAFLTKGPPALLPLLALVVATRWSRLPLRPLFDPVGLLMFVAVALPWFLLVIERNPGLLAYLIRDELIARSFSAQHGRSPEWWGGLFVYGATLLVGTMPFGFAIAGAWRRSPLTASGRAALDHDDRRLWAWLLVPLLVFVVARSRLPLYLLPLFPAIALIVARHWMSAPERLRRRLWLVPLALLAWLVLKAAAAQVENRQDMRAMAAEIRNAVPFTARELVFVAERPRYGLGFYLRVESEWIDLGRNTGAEKDDTLDAELRQPEGARLYLVPPEHVARFQRIAKVQGQRIEGYGDVRGLSLFGLVREADGVRD